MSMSARPSDERQERLREDTPFSSAHADRNFPLLIAEWRKSGSDLVRVQLSRYLDRTNVDLRVWFVPDGGVDPRPSKTGITMSARHLPALAAAMAKALAEAQRRGLVAGEGASRDR